MTEITFLQGLELSTWRQCVAVLSHEIKFGKRIPSHKEKKKEKQE